MLVLSASAILAFIAGFCSFSLALFALWQPPSKKHGPAGVLYRAVFAALGGLGLVVAWSTALPISAPTLAAPLLWANGQALGLVGLPLVWGVFVLRYCGRLAWPIRWQQIGRLLLFAIVPLLTPLMILTNDYHHLLWITTEPLQRGQWFWVMLVYAYSLNGLSLHHILLTLPRATTPYRQQALLLLLALIIPWMGHALSATGLSLLPHLDLTPAALGVSALVLLWAAARYHLFELPPLPRDHLLDAIAEAVLVLDSRNVIVDANRAAQGLFKQPLTQVIGQPTRQALNVHPTLLAPPQAATEQLELLISGRHYEVTLHPLRDRTQRILGRSVTFRDITARWQAETELRAQKRLFEDLVAIARGTAESPSLHETLQNALNIATTLTGAERGSLFLLDENGLVIDGLMTFGLTPGARAEIVSWVMTKGLAGWVYRAQQPALLNDTESDERWFLSPTDPHPARSALGVPILSGAILVGVLTLSHSQPGRFSSEHLRLMQAAGDQMALALRNAQIYDTQRRMAERQSLLYNVLRAMEEQSAPRAAAQAAVEAIVETMDVASRRARWPGVGIAVPHLTAGYWEVYAASGSVALPLNATFPLGRGVIGRAYATGQTQYVPDVRADPDYLVLHPACQSELAIPLRRGDRLLGVLNLESDQLEGFDQDDRQLAESLADAMALALDNAALYQAVTDESDRLQAIIKASRDGLVLIGVDHNLLVINAMALQLLQAETAPEDWLGRPIFELLLTMRRPVRAGLRVLLREARRVVVGDEPPMEGEVDLGERKVRWLHLLVRTGDLRLGRLLILRDITDDYLTQKMRNDLTDTLVHDLRNPLANMKISLELIDTAPPAELAHTLAATLPVSRNSVHRMLMMVNAILDVSRLESGKMPLVRVPLALRPLGDEALAGQAPLAADRQLQLRNAISPTAPCVWADADLIRRVLDNLIGNAIKFSPARGHVTLNAEPDPEQPEAYWRVEVCDQGPGLPPEVQANLFSKFATGAHRARGSGLGLAFCRLAVEAHGGHIWAENNAPEIKGSTFRFTLPVYPSPD
jgi:signal transduction histidine kinase